MDVHVEIKYTPKMGEKGVKEWTAMLSQYMYTNKRVNEILSPFLSP
jgi:hypothetical protein